MLRTVAALLLVAGSLPGSPRPVDGFWKSDGWASVYEIHGDGLQLFEVTSTTCVLGASAKRLLTASEEPATFRTHDGNLLYLTPGKDERHSLLQQAGALIGMTLTRLSGLPPVCSPPTVNTPLTNFNVFSRTFSENYIAFDLRHINWSQTVAAQRPKVAPQITSVGLFEILKSMIEPFGDIHTGIDAPSLNRAFNGPLRSGTDRVVRGNMGTFETVGRRELARITDRAYFHDRLTSYCRGQWRYGLTKTGVGYLRILQFGGYSRTQGFEHNVAALNHALDQIIGNPSLRSLVIDLRLSFGGDDRLGLAIASRFTASPYVAYSVQARSDGSLRNSFTRAERVFVQSGIRPLFTGPIVQLTGPITMSAAETFVQALMERRPQVTRIGEPSQGVFCDSLERHLPNGWTFYLPNAVYRTSNNKAFDAVGIPPDIAVPVFAEQDLEAGRDPAMAAALQFLTE